MSNEMLEERIAQLERENRKLNRRVKLGGMSLLALLGGVVLMGQAKSEKVPDVVRAQRFEVVAQNSSSGCQNSDGKVMASFGWSRGEQCGIHLWMRADDGHGEQVHTILEPGRLYLGGFPSWNAHGLEDVSLLELVTNKEGGERGASITLKDNDQKVVWHTP